jgi:hypothetical protein
MNVVAPLMPGILVGTRGKVGESGAWQFLL